MTNKVRSLVQYCLVLLFLFSAASCERRSCKDVVCGQNQQCLNGNCLCENGYEGANCATLSNTKYLGNYNVYESCSSGASNFLNYTTYITSDAFDPSLIYINNLFGQSVQASAYITTDASNQGNTLYIPSQSFGGMNFSGQGTFDVSLNRITLQLNYTYNFSSYSCTHTFYKF